MVLVWQLTPANLDSRIIPHVGLKDDIGMVSSLFARSEQQAGQNAAKGSRMN